MASRIPHLLEPYLTLPPENSHVLLTSVLGASTNWLVLRYIYSYLQKKIGPQDDGVAPKESINVVLVSFMRDFAFWKEGAGRMGLDLESLGRSGRFVFVDGLTSLFTPPNPRDMPRKGLRTLRSAKHGDIRRDLLSAVTDVASATDGTTAPKTVLIVDQPDFLLAATSDLLPDNNTLGEELSSGVALRNLLLDVQEKVYASIITVAADEPLVSTQTTKLEKEGAALVLSLAHSAETVMSMRLLDTGSASDVSGVIRVTKGGSQDEEQREVEEGELLYFVGGDGNVNVFQRGQGS